MAFPSTKPLPYLLLHHHTGLNLQILRIYGNLILGYPDQPPLAVIRFTQLLLGGGWSLPLPRHAHTEFTP